MSLRNGVRAMQRVPRTYDNILMLLMMAGVPWDEACRLAREFQEREAA